MNHLIKLSKLILIPVFLLSLIGCAIPNPAKPEDTLLVGQMTLDAKGWYTYTSTSVNGEQKANIYIYLQNCDTKHTYMVSTNRYGLFSINNLKPGSYLMKEFAFEIKGDNSTWEHLDWQPGIGSATFQIKPGQVINMGSLHWIANKTDKIYRMSQDNGSAEALKASFAEKYPKSLWLEREWVNVNINTPDNENPPQLTYGGNKIHS